MMVKIMWGAVPEPRKPGRLLGAIVISRVISATVAAKDALMDSKSRNQFESRKNKEG